MKAHIKALGKWLYNYTQVKYIFFLNHNTGTNLYTSIVHNTSIPVLRSPSTGDPPLALNKGYQPNFSEKVL
jgi:hypothetical protein